MNPILEPIIKTVRQLPIPDQLELISEVTRSLSIKYGIPDYGRDFWNPRSLDEIIDTSPAKPISDIEALFGDFWPDEFHSQLNKLNFNFVTPFLCFFIFSFFK